MTRKRSGMTIGGRSRKRRSAWRSFGGKAPKAKIVMAITSRPIGVLYAQHFQRALATFEKAKGKNLSDVASSSTNLAVVVEGKASTPTRRHSPSAR